MAVWVVTGKLGAGKTLMSVSRIHKYLWEGRKVATNLNIYPQNMVGYDSKKIELYRLPDIPTIETLQSLPRGYDDEKIDESKNGLLVLDECGIFLDSRGWNDPKRKPINAFFKLLRKLRWDAILIIQDIDNLDSDARRTIAEHVVYCRRMDRMRIPLVSPLLKSLFGIDLPLPQLHMGIVRYGTEASSIKVDQWNYYGTGLYNAYDTEQLFSEAENYSGIDGLTRILPPYYTHGRYITKLQRFKNAVKNYQIKGTHFFLIGAALASLAVNAMVTFEPEQPKKGVWSCNDAYKQLFGSCSAKPIAPYEYYYPQSEATPSQTDKDAQAQPEAVIAQRKIYIAGWQVTTKGVFMNFMYENGDAYYPLSYRVREMGNCVARVQIDYEQHVLTCMPEKALYALAASNSEQLSQ